MEAEMNSPGILSISLAEKQPSAAPWSVCWKKPYNETVFSVRYERIDASAANCSMICYLALKNCETNTSLMNGFLRWLGRATKLQDHMMVQKAADKFRKNSREGRPRMLRTELRRGAKLKELQNCIQLPEFCVSESLGIWNYKNVGIPAFRISDRGSTGGGGGAGPTSGRVIRELQSIQEQI